MKKIFGSIAIASLLVQSQSTLASDYISPNSPWVLDGVVYFNKVVTYDCDMTVTINGPNDRGDSVPPFDHSDVSNLSATISMSGGPVGFCIAVMVDPVSAGSISYDSTGPSSGILTLHDVYVNYEPGDCEGDLTFIWNETSRTLDLVDAIPGVSGAACQFKGRLSLVSPSTGDINDALDADHNANH